MGGGGGGRSYTFPETRGPWEGPPRRGTEWGWIRGLFLSDRVSCVHPKRTGR